LHLASSVNLILSWMGLKEFSDIVFPTYYTPSMEVLSSCYVKENPRYGKRDGEEKWKFHFRYGNKDYSLAMSEFAKVFKLPNEGLEERPKKFNGSDTWAKIRTRPPLADGTESSVPQGKKDYDPPLAKHSMVYNPSIRYVLKIIASSINNRADGNAQVQVQDSFYLHSMMMDTSVNYALLFARHLEKIGRTEKGMVSVGGYVTALLSGLGFKLEDHYQVDLQPQFLDLANGVSARWLEEYNGSWWYKFHEMRVLRFPNRAKTTHTKRNNLKPVPNYVRLVREGKDPSREVDTRVGGPHDERDPPIEDDYEPGAEIPVEET
jgi:hypothetical protein